MLGNLINQFLRRWRRTPAFPLQTPAAAMRLDPWLAMADAGELDAALSGLAALLDGSVADAEVHVEIARLRYTSGDAAGAAQALQAALALCPDLALCHANLGHMAVDRLDPAAAVAHYDAALAIDPSLLAVELARAGALLQAGDYTRGFAAYECRWKSVRVSERSLVLGQPRWDGRTDLAGKTVLVYAEQGFGDTLQFARFVPALITRGARVVLQCQRELVSLLRATSGLAEVVVKGDALPAFDWQIPLASLPLACGTTLATLQAPRFYLTADAGKATQWREKLSSLQRPLAGVVWASRSEAADAVKKSLTIEALLPLLKAGSGHLVSLQTGVTAGGNEAQVLADYGVPDLAALLHDFSDTAALIAELDLLITVDTAVAHLAGALGKPCWVLLQRNPDWRWMLARDDSPWYPSVRLFRQTRRGDWSPVVDAAGLAFSAWTAATAR